MNLDMTVHIYKEGGQYVAHAMPLDVMSSGTTRKPRARPSTKPCAPFSSPRRTSELWSRCSKRAATSEVFDLKPTR
jgi:hypothetical protein